MAPKLLLMDLDGVLVDYSQDARCRHLAQTAGVDAGTIRRALFGSGLEKRADRGEFGLGEYLDRLRRDWGIDLPQDDFIAARRHATRVRPDMLALCGALAGQVQLGIFSNNGHWLQQHAERIVPGLMPLFRTRFVCSGSLGHCKPDLLAYSHCLERLGFQARSCLFVDDRPENVDGARAAGLDAFIFENGSQCRAELARRGLPQGEPDAH